MDKIRRLVIDAEDGRPVYVVLSIDGFMGMRNKLFVISYTRLPSRCIFENPSRAFVQDGG